MAALLLAGLITVPALQATAATRNSTVRVQLSAPHQEYGSPISAVAHARSNGKPVPGRVRYFFDGKLAHEARTDRNGNTRWRLQASIAVGRHTMQVYFLPSVPGMATSATSVPVTVKRATPRISVATPQSRPPFGSWTTMSIAVSARNLGWANGRVELYEGDRHIDSATLRRGATQIHFPITGTPGNNVFTVRYAGSAAIADGWRAVRFRTSRAVPSIGITGLSASTTGGKVSVAVGGGPRPASGRVTALVDGSIVTKGRLDSSGNATLSLPKLSPGGHTVKVRYRGDLRYVRGVVAKAFTVKNTSNPCSPSARACVDLTNDRAWIQENGRIIYGPVPMTSGRPGYRTSTGMFSVYWKDIDHRSSIFDDAPMPYSIFFNGGEAFHEGSVYITSHGCIHLTHDAAVYFWNALDYGDSVHVFGYAPY